MCRLLAICGEFNQERTTSALKKFKYLAESGVVPPETLPGHKDGWGIIAYNSQQEIVVAEKEPSAASASNLFEKTAKKIEEEKPVCVIAHLRKASIGENKKENTQPYNWQNFSFCHNGTVKNFESLPLTEPWLKLRRGTSDSEWIFYHLIQEMNKKNDSTETSLANLVKDIQSTEYTACNALYCDGKNLYAIREVNEKNELVKNNNLCEHYYTLFKGISRDEKITIVSSEKLEIEGIEWKELNNHSITKIELTK